jgi:hypothetical protein
MNMPTEDEMAERLLRVLTKVNAPIRLSELLKRAELEEFRKAAEEAVSNLIYRGEARLNKDLMLVRGTDGGRESAERAETETPA